MKCYLAWSDTGVSWYSDSKASYQLNTASRDYFYLAIG